ncbi:MAG TPA: hypothetical protein VLR89_09790 [Anaerolineaceae bacterium]|nr:hypothetical protein [Anaerolineaceae bacterium]
MEAINHLPYSMSNTMVEPKVLNELHGLPGLASFCAPQSRPGFLRSLREVDYFTEIFGGIRLRAYQRAVARAVTRSVLGNLGHSIVVMFPRQTGKNLLQAELEVYFLAMFSRQGAEMVKFSPTFLPQSINAMQRLETALEANRMTQGRWQKNAGNHYKLGRAHLTFLSAAPESNVVGATASTLLELDEAQDISLEKYDKQIAPMAASTNATRVFWGTAWTDQTLLARELRAARAAEERDGQRRVFWISAEAVRTEVPAYGNFVDEIVARLGRSHPSVRSQYFGEEIQGAGSLFTSQRIGLMHGSHAALSAPQAGKVYAMLVDLAGEDEALRDGPAEDGLANPGRDASAVTLIEVDTQWLADSLFHRPRYKVVCRYQWVGLRQAALFSQLLDLAEHWQAQKLIVDASGVGAGVASFLRDRLGERVLPLVFNQSLKSKLGWNFLSIIDTGRFQDYFNQASDAFYREQSALQAIFEQQLLACQYKVNIGPEKTLHWGVPEGTREAGSRQFLHDDLLISAAMTAVLDEQDWTCPAEPMLIAAPDPIREMEGAFK